MKNAILVLMLCSANLAICQSAAPRPFELSPVRPLSAQPWILLGKPPSGRPIITLTPRRSFVLPKLTPERGWDDARIDSKIIAHPSPSKLGAQPPGALVAQDQFSGLQLLPNGSSDPRPKAVPTQWPDLNLQAIPVQWPKFKLLLVEAGTPASPPPSAK